MRTFFPKLKWPLGVLAAAAIATPAHAIRMYTSVTFPYPSININDAVGADAFYGMGIFGQGATVVNIEGGLPWAGHDAFSSKIGYEAYNGTGAKDSNNITAHATTCSMLLAGDEKNGDWIWEGIAPKATLKAGNIATSFGNNNSFNISDKSLSNTYLHFVTAGADVISSSYGGTFTAKRDDWQINIINTIAASYTHTTIFFAAGNESKAGTVGTPAVAHNVITVGALDASLSQKASYSSYAPSNFYLPTSKTEGTVILNARASVDIVAPGTNLTTARTDSDTQGYSGSGTSYATPIVAGGATLMASLSRSLDWGEESRDSRVVKAVLLNSANKNLAGWTNNTDPAATVSTKNATGETVVFSNVALTKQALDYQYGAGALDLDAALRQYYTDTARNPDNTLVKAGWTLDHVNKYDTYLAAETIIVSKGASFTVTLTWLADYLTASPEDMNYDMNNTALADLNLEVWKTDDLGNLDMLIAASRTLYDTVEHLTLNIAEETRLRVRVLHDGMTYDLRSEPAPGEDFALAWSVSAGGVVPLGGGVPGSPEPSTYALWGGVLALALAQISRRRRKRNFAKSAR